MAQESHTRIRKLADRQDQLSAQIQSALAGLERLIDGGELGSKDSFAGYSKDYRTKLALLRALVDSHAPVLVPELSASAPLGHRCEVVETSLSLEPGQGLEVLEELADLRLLHRELHNRIHLCPRCSRCQVNFRETCPACRSFDLTVERLVRHFSCAYSGLESEFEQGLDLVCPKCRAVLRQIGEDFDRPHQVYACHESGHTFEDPAIEGQCLQCEHLFAGAEVEVRNIYRYRSTPLAVRAVELNRLTGLDVSEIMYDAELKLASSDFLEIEVQRELFRMERYGGSFVTATLRFEIGGKTVPFFREATGATLHILARLLVDSLRTLDLVARIDASTLGILLIETDIDGSEAVWKRLGAGLGELIVSTKTGTEMRPYWSAMCWDDPKTKVADVLAFVGAERRSEP